MVSSKWYCERCSLPKNLQRDVRDISREFDQLGAGRVSELAHPDQLQRAFLRLREIATILSTQEGGSQLIDQADVDVLIERLYARTASPSTAG